jgi:predicted Zn-dependent protease
VTLETRLSKLETAGSVSDRGMIWIDRGPDGESLEQAMKHKFGDAIPADLVVIVMHDNGRDRLEP